MANSAPSRPSDYNTKIIEEFRANGGHVGGPWAGITLILIHHIGAKSGIERVSPLAYSLQGDGRFAIWAANGGSPGPRGPSSPPTRPGPGSRRRQAALIVARGGPAFAVKARRRRGIPVVSRHTSIKRKGLAVSWLTHCRNRLSRRWRIRSRS